MKILQKKLLLPTCLLALTSGLVHADGLADRMSERSTIQQMDPIERAHQTWGPTAAGPATDDMKGMKMDEAMEPRTAQRIDYPEGVDTAHERFRYLFESGEF